MGVRPANLEVMIENLIQEAGPEWDFLMGSSIKALRQEGGVSRRIYWATLSTHVLHDGGFARTVKVGEGFLRILSAERHHSFPEALRDLTAQYHKFVGGTNA